jgi:hypothetical protein
MKTVTWWGVFACGALWAQDPMAARRLYYQDNAPEVVLRADAVVARVNPPKGDAKAAPVPIKKVQNPAPAVPYVPPKNLGVRYNVLQVNQANNERRAVAADTVFKQGDCVAVRLQPNRAGFVYVFHQGSSGKWSALLPSAEMTDESNQLKAFQVAEIPQKYCFEFDDKPGEEKLFVVLTEKPEDAKTLNDLIRKEKGGSSRPEGVEVASLNQKVEGLRGELQSRDLKITRVGNPVTKDEPAHSIYLVNAAAAKSDRMVLDITLKHGR